MQSFLEKRKYRRELQSLGEVNTIYWNGHITPITTTTIILLMQYNNRQHAEIVKKRVVIEEAIDSAESELSPLSAENKHKLNSDVNCN